MDLPEALHFCSPIISFISSLRASVALPFSAFHLSTLPTRHPTFMCAVFSFPNFSPRQSLPVKTLLSAGSQDRQSEDFLLPTLIPLFPGNHHISLCFLYSILLIHQPLFVSCLQLYSLFLPCLSAQREPQIVHRILFSPIYPQTTL